jgi:hypothetical protein
MKHRRKSIGGNSLAMVKTYFPKAEIVEDATNPAIVEVTTADNNNADVKSHRTCALAIACKRFFKADGVIIGLTTSWIVRGKVATRYRNAGTVSREITSFDRKAGFDTGLYILSPASPSNRLGLERSYDPVRAGTKKGIRKFKHFTRNVRTSLLHHSGPVIA